MNEGFLSVRGPSYEGSQSGLPFKLACFPMSTVDSTSSDAQVLDLLRSHGPLSVAQMASAMQVTPTAVRQRLGRLLAQGVVSRQPVRSGRGRPWHAYSLTQKGLRLTGSNFTDLALALWREIRAMSDGELRRVLVRRLAATLAEAYSGQVLGRSTGERMRSLTSLLGQRRVPFSVEQQEGVPVLKALACPYPELAEADPDVCLMETILFGDLLGEEVQLAECRREGAPCCRFQPVRSRDKLVGSDSRQDPEPPAP